tara:strand:- start:636 stop:1088 length:453 start_codon:yes stop_codon:yes gene_type:complete
VRSVVDIRQRATEAVLTSSNDGMPKQHAGLYWEKYEDKGENPEWLVYARYEISTSAQRSMHRIYTDEKELAGGKVVTGFPLLAWAYSDFEGGVMVTEATGELEAVGADAVITRVGAQNVRNSVEFAKAIEQANGSFTKATVMPPLAAAEE